MDSMQTVYVIDDDEALRDSMYYLMESVGLGVRTYPTAQAFLEQYNHEMSGCIVADLNMPGMGGLDLQDRLNELGCRLPVIFLTGHGTVPRAIRAMKAGAFDFLEKSSRDQEGPLLVDRIRGALNANELRANLHARQKELQRRANLLSPRERQVMDMVVQGKLNKQIATVLELSHKTIEVHRAHVMEKMGASSLAELVRIAMELEHAHS